MSGTQTTVDGGGLALLSAPPVFPSTPSLTGHETPRRRLARVPPIFGVVPNSVMTAENSSRRTVEEWALPCGLLGVFSVSCGWALILVEPLLTLGLSGKALFLLIC